MHSRTTKLIFWTGLLAGIAAWTWFGWLRFDVFPRNFGEVEKGKVYRSAALTPAAVQKVVREHGIRTIIDLGGFDKDPIGDRNAARTAEALGIERYVFNLEGDGTGNPNAYVAALKVMNDPARQPVLVHCSAGAQRTSGAVMLYRDFVQGKPLEETYAEAQQYRHDPSRNPRLMPYLKQHEREIREAWLRGCMIEHYPQVPIAPVAAP
ncbi:MAG: fused DSP-PTPase phosphatase/NAD kinase-like protein [Phycisphaerales bacterium]